MLRVRLLGSFEVWRHDHLITPHEWRTRKARTLMKVLVHARGRSVSFGRLHELLWPNRSAQTAANCLHTDLTYVRRALEGEAHVSRASPYIYRSDSGYMLVRSNAWIDVDEFHRGYRSGQAAIRDGRLEAAVEEFERATRLYRGDYLEEDMYEEWAAETREWLRERYLGMLATLGVQYMALRRYDDAADAARLMLERDPLREQGSRVLMMARHFQGEKAGALQVYRRLSDLLATELQTEPAEETKMLLQAIVSGRLAPEFTVIAAYILPGQLIKR